MITFTINGPVFIGVGARWLAEVPPLMRFDPHTRRIFGLTVLEQQLAILGKCPLCRKRGAIHQSTLDLGVPLDGLDLLQCWSCGKLLIVSHFLYDPFLCPINSPRRNSANDF